MHKRFVRNKNHNNFNKIRNNNDNNKQAVNPLLLPTLIISPDYA